MIFKILTLTAILASQTSAVDHSAHKTPQMVEVIKATWKVGLDLYKQLTTENEHKSFFYSPYGLTSSLFGLYLGAEGTTKTNIEEELGIPGLNEEHLKVQSNIHKVVKANEGKYDIYVAKEFYFDNTINLLPSYTSELQKYFELKPDKEDFKHPDKVKTKINQEVAKKTHNKIKDLVPAGLLKPDFKFVIASAVYFKGYFAKKFDGPKEAPFTKIDGTTHTQKYMHQTGVYKLATDEALGVKMIELPYRTNHHAVYIVLPTTPKGLTDFETKNLNTETLKALRAKLQPKTVNVQIPEFETKSHYELSSELKAMGLTEPFEMGKADFSKIDKTAKEDKLALNLYLQESQIEFDPDGDDHPSKETPVNATPEDFHATHSFMYAIICQTTNVPFFLGKYTGMKH